MTAEAQLPEEIKKSATWREAAAKLLRSIDNWEKDSKLPNRHRFTILVEIYFGLLNIIPAEDRVATSEALQRIIKLMNDESTRRDVPVIWLLKWSDLYTCLSIDKRIPLLRAAVQSSGDGVMAGLLEIEGDEFGTRK